MLAVDTVTSKTAANPVVVNGGMTINNTLTVDIIANQLANEVTVNNNFAVGGHLAGVYN